MTEPPNRSARFWVIGGVVGLAAILAFVFAVPGNLLNALQLLDRLNAQDTSSTSTSTPAVPQGTDYPSRSSTPPWSPADVPDPPAEPPPVDHSPSVSQPPPLPTSEAPPAIPSVDHIEISTWAYNPAGPPNTYVADNNGGKKIRVSWTSSAGGYDVSGGCTSSVRITGPGTDRAENSSNCSDSMGTYLDVNQPGNYTVTVTTYQKSGAQHSDSIPVTIR
ncbi:hypothetical protein FHT44_006253 [Mycolicibacterium sp. BK634]|uniref:hypothetical protein n=1 Tax=Mycolicibacterium sp. BK634 TaxID=2587099 RepID=UPI000D4F8143|nr:hypothetical protein [Mycolicibacterium sp. BK634]MBB3753731.1 hypothetical protein [Mycolicibacterium sp. BK634]